MTALLELVADGAYPHDPYSILPASCKTWAGYVGGHTPHTWTMFEVNQAESDGLEWLGIWTGPDLRAITAADADADAAGCIAAYRNLGYSTDRPALYDVESAAWHADPTLTTASAERWCNRMRDAGWMKATWYGPCQSAAGWRACWDDPQPLVLPPGCHGVQFAHGLAGDAYDLSVFDPAWIGAPMSAQGPASWDQADWDAVAHQLSYLVDAIGHGSNSVYSNPNPVAKVLAAVEAIPAAGSGPAAYTGTINLHAGT